MKKHKNIRIMDAIVEVGWLLIAFIVPIIFSYWPLIHNLIQLPKAVVFSILVEIMFVAFILKIFIQGEIRFKAFDKKILIILSFLILSNLISLFFSIHPLRSLFGEYIRQNGFYIFIHYILFFLLLLFNLRDWKQVKRIIFAILFSSALVCAYGLMQYLGLGFTEWQRTAFAPVNGRIYSSLGQPNFFGHYLIMVIPISIFSIFFVVKNFLVKFIIIILAASQAVCLLLTYSRSAWVGFIFEIILFLLFLFIFFRKKIFNKVLIYRYYIPVFLLLTIIFSFNLLFSNDKTTNNFFIYRAKSIANLKTGSVKLRLLYWSAAIEEIKGIGAKRLLFGYGQENISDVYVKYYNKEWSIYGINSYPDRSHNSILDIIFTTGLLGLALISLFYFYIIAAALKYLKKKKIEDKEFWFAISLLVILGGYFINNLFSFSTVTTYIYLFIALALLNFLTMGGDEGSIKIHLTKISRVLIYLSIFFIVGISIYLYNIKPIIADYYLMKADIAESKKDCNEVLKNLKKVLEIQPSNIYYQNKYIYFGLNCLSKENDIRTNLTIKNNIIGVTELMDEKERYYKVDLNIARAFSLFGFHFSEKFGDSYYKRADYEYNKLLKENPNFIYVYSDWGRMKLWRGNYDDAIIILNRGLDVMASLDDKRLGPELIEHRESLKKEYAIFYFNIGEAYFHKNDWDNALIYYKKVMEITPYNLVVYKRIADVYFNLGDIDKAILYNKRGYSLNTEDRSWLLNISFLYKELGNEIKFLEYREKAEINTSK